MISSLGNLAPSTKSPCAYYNRIKQNLRQALQKDEMLSALSVTCSVMLLAQCAHAQTAVDSIVANIPLIDGVWSRADRGLSIGKLHNYLTKPSKRLAAQTFLPHDQRGCRQLDGHQ